jgi:hypothetical protein
VFLEVLIAFRRAGGFQRDQQRFCRFALFRQRDVVTVDRRFVVVGGRVEAGIHMQNQADRAPYRLAVRTALNARSWPAASSPATLSSVSMAVCLPV